MASPLLARIWAWLHATFPERQVYIRSNGRVQFFTFGASLQATMAGLALIFLGWVSFATVNVVFKDRIIAAKDHRFQQMQSAYENRLADLQISYDELNGALVGAEDKFKATADALSAKQNAIAGFIARKNQIEAAVGARGPAAPAPQAVPAALHDDAPASDSLDFDGVAAPGDDENSLTVAPGPAPAQPRVEKPARASMLDRARIDTAWISRAWTGTGEALNRLVGLVTGRRQTALRGNAAYAQHPALRDLAAQTARVAALDTAETGLMVHTEDMLQGDVGLLRDTIRRTGINPDQFLAKGREAEGGPEIPLDQVHVQGSDDPGFDVAYLQGSALMGELNGLSAQMDHIPFIAPVPAAQFDRSSGFGARVDPFTGRYAFHPGIDFAGPWGASVVATAPGTVIFAGNRGGYGNMVEIDHGMGLHTRYGHLSQIGVRPGMRVAKGAVVGRVGSTGRSTGPHVHYEIWYDSVVRNPGNFLEAGHHVL